MKHYEIQQCTTGSLNAELRLRNPYGPVIWRKVKRKTSIDDSHDAKWDNCRSRSLIDDGIDIAKVMKHHALDGVDGETAATTYSYTNSVLNEGVREGHIDDSTFDGKQATLYGHTYKGLQKGYEHAQRDYGGYCTCKGCTARFRYSYDNQSTTIEGKHSPNCMMRQIIRSGNSQEFKDVVVLDYVLRVETIVDTVGKLVSLLLFV